MVVPERWRRGTVGWVTASCTWPGWQGRMHCRRESPCAVAAPIWEEGVVRRWWRWWLRWYRWLGGGGGDRGDVEVVEVV